MRCFRSITEDIDLICELGATTIRLAHYQHDQYFYDLCDERGLVIWAEIPYISSHMPNGRENTISQMKELVVQELQSPEYRGFGGFPTRSRWQEARMRICLRTTES